MRVRHLTVVLTLAATFGCGTEAPPPDAAATTAPAPEPALLSRLNDEQAEGRTIHESICWTCHGISGRGDGPALQSDTAGTPPDFIAEGYATLPVDELLSRFQAPLDGAAADPEHPHMRYVLSVLRPERLRAALSYVPVLAWPAEVPGSAFTGMTLYQTRCAACHGVEGDGEGYAADALVLSPPADFRTDTLVAAGDYQGLFRRIRDGGRTVHGSSMPPWGVALGEEEMWDLVAYVSTFREGTLPPFPGESR